MLQNMLKIFLVLTSIFSAFFIPKKSLVKYIPVTLFSSTTLLAEILYFTTHKLWKVKGSQKGKTSTALSLVFGPYFFSNLWVFHLAKGSLLRYSLINIIADLLYAYPGIKLFRKLNFFKLKVSSFQFFLLIITNSYINFAFQKIFEKLTIHKHKV
jgi:hypothetical protein